MSFPRRFAGWIRVSTEAQEEQGESLHTQKKQVVSAVAQMEGTIVAWYGGQEHATEGWEREELKRMVKDSTNDQFDAVCLATLDRWNRGSEEAHEALKVFKKHRVRFFVGTTEYDLYNPEHEFMLEVNSAMGKYQAATSTKKALREIVWVTFGGQS
jgi:DNA invertase Pin-like site-specific DNA recombinase